MNTLVISVWTICDADDKYLDNKRKRLNTDIPCRNSECNKCKFCYYYYNFKLRKEKDNGIS